MLSQLIVIMDPIATCKTKQIFILDADKVTQGDSCPSVLSLHVSLSQSAFITQATAYSIYFGVMCVRVCLCLGRGKVLCKYGGFQNKS